MKTVRFLTAMACVGSVQMALAGDITGKITLKGTPDPEKQLPVAGDPFCGKLFAGKPIPTTRFYVVDASGGLADTFVYLKEGVTSKPAPPTTPVVLDQSGCEYLPYVVGVQTGQPLLVKNSDPLLHNVHPTPTVAGNKEANLAQAPGAKPLTFSFANPEVFLRFKCDVHNWMFSYVGVVAHPYFAVSGKDGTFKIANVPPGEYVIEAVHRKTHPGGKGVTQKLKVGADGAKADFTIELAAK